MYLLFRAIVCGLLLVASWMSVGAQTYDFTPLDRILQDSVRNAGGVGNGIAVVLVKDGRTVYSKGFGGTILNPYTPQRIVPIASATKWLSGAVIMSLVQEGRLRLDDTVGRYLSTFTGSKSRITIRQLFSHTSGIPGSPIDNTDQTSYHSNRALTLQEATDSIGLRVNLLAPPGTVFAYGGASMHVAGRIAELVSGINLPSGLAWDTLFARRIAQPLGMRNTNFDGLGSTNNPQIAGGAQSSAEEYAQFLTMLLQGGRNTTGSVVLTSSAIDTMFADHTRNAPIGYTPYQQYAYLDGQMPQSRYGIGNWIEYRTGVPPERRTNSSQGAFGFSPWIDRTRTMAGVMSVFSVLGSAMPTYTTIRDVIQRIIDRPTSTQTRSVERVSLRIAPHPASASDVRISVECPAHLYDQPCTITLHSMLGETVGVVYEGVLRSAVHCSLPSIMTPPAGVYLLRCTSLTGSWSQPIVLVR